MVALVDGVPIRMDEVRQEVARVRGALPVKALRDAEARALAREVIGGLIERRVLVTAAKARGATVGPAEIRAEVERLQGGSDAPEPLLRAVEERLLVDRLVARDLPPTPAPRDDEALAYYREHRDEFAVREAVRARQVVVATREEGEEVRRLALRGTPIGRLARERSIAPEATREGDLGYVTRGQMPREVEGVLFGLRPREISAVVASPYGYHVVTVEDVRPPRLLPFDEAQATIRERLAAERREEAYRTWMRRLLAASRIEIHDAVLQGLTARDLL